jgi:hypothetical protein
MATAKDDETAMLDALLGPMTLSESAKRETNETEPPTAKNGTAHNKKLHVCSACGKERTDLKLCNGCKCIWYCDKDCQNRHRKEHRKECKRIKKELDTRDLLGKQEGKYDLGFERDIGPPGKLPQREECPICMCLMPLEPLLQEYFSCCGKIICRSCYSQHNLKSMEQRLPLTCAYCRAMFPIFEEDVVARLTKSAERKDPRALLKLAMHHGDGNLGLPVDQAKCIDLLRESAGLGHPDAQYQLGNFYKFGEMGLEQNDAEALKYWEKAAEGGHIAALHNLGCAEGRDGNYVAAMRHFRLAVSGGRRESIETLIAFFEKGLLHHGDLAEALQAFYLATSEIRSENRGQATMTSRCILRSLPIALEGM